MTVRPAWLPALAALLPIGSAAVAQTTIPTPIALPGTTIVAMLHATGAQVYECRAAANGALAWQFREPIATLLEHGRTVGRHYAGPTWELTDGSTVVGRVTGQAPAGSPDDIAWLRLAVVEHHGTGRLTPVTAVQRIATQGGAAGGTCETAGAFRSVAYAADYLFLSGR